MLIKEAKNALDKVIAKSRIHLYKPIQIAEILYRHRVFSDIDLNDLETYRTKSKIWRDEVCALLLGRICTSSAKFQDDLFNAIPPRFIATLGMYNKEHKGIVEAYIYSKFLGKYTQLNNALDYCFNLNKESFKVKDFINLFWYEAGLKRSLDKVYEIIVYALFDTLAKTLEIEITLHINKHKMPLLQAFSDFAKAVIGFEDSTLFRTQNARIYRVGVTNAADRGLDMYANWDVAIQIKHLSLDEALAENIVSSINSDRIIIVCKEAEKKIILSLITQIGWKSRIQSIITESDLVIWYERALREQYADEIGDKLLESLRLEIMKEFPPTKDLLDIIKKRDYQLQNIKDDIFNTNTQGV